MTSPSLRDLPAISRLLEFSLADALIGEYGRPLTTDALRAALDNARTALQAGQTVDISPNALLQNAQTLLKTWLEPTLQPVINATGVVLHTNLGRAPLSSSAIRAMEAVARNYSNLEYDLEQGKRGSRLTHAEELLCRLTGAEAALVVNNNAAAVMLVLAGLASRRRVLVARTQLVEIGGSFRVPDIMKQSGARLVEIGTTNRVHLRDYEQALREQPIRAVLRAHRSNFRLIGFTTEPTLEEIVQVAHAHNIPVIDDLGSGVLLDTRRYGLGYEPRVQDSLAAGADIVCFSGDKLLGGPQAGIIVGRKLLVDKLKKHPLARALRVEKTRLAALMATLQHYLKDEAERTIPIWQMIAAQPKTLRSRAAAWAEALGAGEVIATESAIGGGSLPGETLPTFALALRVKKPAALAARLRAASPPVIARIQDDLLLFDPRTVFPEQEAALLRVLKETLSEV